MKDILEYPELQWNRTYLSCNSHLTVEVINLLCTGIGDWNWTDISTYINIQEVVRYPHLRWSKNGLSHNKGITLQLINTLDLPNATGEWDWYSISKNIPKAEIFSCEDRLDYIAISIREDIDISEYLQLSVALENVCWPVMTRKTSMDIIRSYPDLPWSKIEMSKKSDIEISDVLLFNN